MKGYSIHNITYNPQPQHMETKKQVILSLYTVVNLWHNLSQILKENKLYQ